LLLQLIPQNLRRHVWLKAEGNNCGKAFCLLEWGLSADFLIRFWEEQIDAPFKSNIIAVFACAQNIPIFDGKAEFHRMSTCVTMGHHVSVTCTTKIAGSVALNKQADCAATFIM